MKLRQKLAMVLAAAMVATSVPMVAMAATSTSANTVNMVYGDRFAFDYTGNISGDSSTTAAAIELSMQNTGSGTISASEANPIQFILTGNDISFTTELYADSDLTAVPAANKAPAAGAFGEDLITNGNIAFIVQNRTYTQYSQNSDGSYSRHFSIQRTSNNEVLVTMYQSLTTNQYLTFPLAMAITGYNPYVTLTGGGLITSQVEINLSTNSSVERYNTSVSIGNEGYISDDGYGSLGSIRFQENKVGAFRAVSGMAGVNYHLQLRDNKLEWDFAAGDILFAGSDVDYTLPSGAKNFTQTTDAGAHYSEYVNLTGGLATSTVPNNILVQVITVDEDEMVINVVENSGSSSNRTLRGYLELTNLPVRLASRSSNLTASELEITIKEVELNGVPVSSIDEDDYSISDFKSTNSVYLRDVIAYIVDEHIVFQAYNELELITGQEVQTAELSMHQIIPDAINTRDKFYLTLTNGYFDDSDLSSIRFDIDGYTISNDGIITGDDDELELDVAALLTAARTRFPNASDQDLLNNIYFELEIGSSLGKEGDITLEIESRNLSEDLSLYLGTSEAAFSVDWEAVNVEPGVKGQTRGEIVITERDEDTFQAKTEIVIQVEGMSIEGATVEVTDDSGLEVSKSVKSDGTLVITIDNESEDGAGSIIIKDVEYTVSGSMPRGSYDMYIGGSAVDINNSSYSNGDHMSKKLTESDYLFVGSDIFAKQLEASIDFNTGIATVDGTEATLFATPFLSDSGRTMVGVRDLATFFNIHEDNIIFTSGGHVTIKNGNDLITLTNGSNIIYKNGQPIYMDEPMQIVNDRSYAPAKYIALALGLNISYEDGVATFSN